jgi:hypothetical protein
MTSWSNLTELTKLKESTKITKLTKMVKLTKPTKLTKLTIKINNLFKGCPRPLASASLWGPFGRGVGWPLVFSGFRDEFYMTKDI